MENFCPALDFGDNAIGEYAMALIMQPCTLPPYLLCLLFQAPASLVRLPLVPAFLWEGRNVNSFSEWVSSRSVPSNYASGSQTYCYVFMS
jgi:hypothetical protein